MIVGLGGGLTLEAVVEGYFAHDLLVFAAQERVGPVGVEQMVGDAVEGAGVEAWQIHVGLGEVVHAGT